VPDGAHADHLEIARIEGVPSVAKDEIQYVGRTVLRLQRSRERQATAIAHVIETEHNVDNGSDFALAARRPQPQRVCEGEGATIAKVVAVQLDMLQLARHALGDQGRE
jgi:hypothetical protein